MARSGPTLQSARAISKCGTALSLRLPMLHAASTEESQFPSVVGVSIRRVAQRVGYKLPEQIQLIAITSTWTPRSSEASALTTASTSMSDPRSLPVTSQMQALPKMCSSQGPAPVPFKASGEEAESLIPPQPDAFHYSS